MKFSKSYLLLSAWCSSSRFVNGFNPQGCLDSASVDPSKDYFPDKVSPEFAKLFSVTYHNTYKVVKEYDGNLTFVLYQCGTDPPSGIEANLTLPVPLQHGVGLTTTTSLPHFELLGLRDEVKVYLGDPQWITSPCMNQRLESGKTINLRYPDEEGALDELFTQISPEIVIYGNLIKGTVASPNFVPISAWKERNNHGIGEWHKFYSLFYNKEKEANEQFETMHSRYECTSKNAGHILADKDRPKVVFAEFSTFCGGWSVGSCPNFYCDFIADCSAEILVDDQSGTVINPDCGLDRPYMTTPEFVEFAKNADVWVYPGHGDYYWDTAYQDFGDQLDTMKSVQNRQVYDTVLTALNTWYEHRIVEYDLVLEDFCQVVGANHALIPHKRAFLRNVFEEEVGNIGECNAELESEGFILRSDVCVDIVEVLKESNAAGGAKIIPWVMTAFSVMAFFATTSGLALF